MRKGLYAPLILKTCLLRLCPPSTPVDQYSTEEYNASGKGDRICRFKSGIVSYAEVAEWQTRYVQGVVSVRACEFKSHLRHHY